MPATVINIQAVRDKLSSVGKNIAMQEEALSSIDRAVNSMEASWESESQKVFTNSFRESKHRIEKFNESLRSELASMGKFVDRCVSDDETTARELRGITW